MDTTHNKNDDLLGASAFAVVCVMALGFFSLYYNVTKYEQVESCEKYDMKLKSTSVYKKKRAYYFGMQDRIK